MGKLLLASVAAATIFATSGPTRNAHPAQPHKDGCCAEKAPATCTPLSRGRCNACKNCKYCNYCSKQGGVCSVCAKDKKK